jgi:hypothetical protein
MPQKPAPKPDNPEQFKRFIETAREVDADDDPKALDRALDRVLGPKRRSEAPKK